MNEYEQRQEARKQRYLELADKFDKEGDAKLGAAHKLAEAIPFGQPILVGHHSEGRDRRYRDRIHNTQGKGFELKNKAEHYREKAEAVSNNDAISSDDPDAVKKLKAKLESMEARRQEIKDHNKLARKDGKEQMPAYVLQNLGANIRRVKERIKVLEARQSQESSEETVGDVRIVSNVEANRVQIFFPGVPDQGIRSKLKSNGFRWSQMNGCWQRHLTGWAVKIAKDIVGGVV